ncbi:HlyD family secretion protein [Pseudoduganella namucuonensis]|uniref:HlyD family secretion protein n=1 Tax=Pseudoduganella namucuonensis TaxID=1035707 RepID=A0A1I7H8D3_9BURK|nr:HlyD family efflux transporter periplasmic adaptor subunit [Pseudoduganella namucuonensis]SFU56975.1 HlyD family secretion protein [Pseudoduganella namucuonensis]
MSARHFAAGFSALLRPALPASRPAVAAVPAILAAALLAQAMPAPAVAASSHPAAAPRPVLLTGQVDAIDSQTIFVPPSQSSPIVLRNFVAEGTSVKAGDVVLRIETGGAANVDRLKLELEQARSRAEREAAKLEATAIDAEKALATARAALAKAKVDAVLPKTQIAALNYDRNQNELDRAQRDLEVRQAAYANARDAVARRRQDGELEAKKLQINIAYQITQLGQSEVRAAHDGVVVHDYSPWRNERFEEGSTAWPGNAAGRVLGSGPMAVVVWALEADRRFLSEGQGVNLRFDALPGAAVVGRIVRITSAPEARASWGRGRYFRVSVALPEGHGLALVPGMSVFAEPLAGEGSATAASAPGRAGAAAVVKAQAVANASAVAKADAKAKVKPQAGASKATGAELAIEGEIASRQPLAIAPPTIPYIWQYKLARMAPEGALVAAGQSVALFESAEVTNRLMEQQGTLNEKQRALEKLKLDHAEAARAGDLAVSEAQSNAEKSARKANLPPELIQRTEYDKLVIERALNAELAKLAIEQRKAQERARRAEMAGMESEVAKLRQSIAELAKGRAALDVVAPRAGRVLYRTSFTGEKFAPGSQIWMGLSVATLADPERLYVSAAAPEAQVHGVRVGQAARVTVSGANQAYAARVTALGRAFHGKSTVQSLMVRDVELEFDSPPQGLKPGAAVQVLLTPALEKSEKAK